MFVGDAWKENNFPFSRMNIFFFFLLYDWKIWDGWEGQLKKLKLFSFLLGRVLFFSFFLLNAIFSGGYGGILAALDKYL